MGRKNVIQFEPPLLAAVHRPPAPVSPLPLAWESDSDSETKIDSKSWFELYDDEVVKARNALAELNDVLFPGHWSGEQHYCCIVVTKGREHNTPSISLSSRDNF